MATRLTDMEIVEISLVDEPANDDAKVVIVKAKDGFKPCDDCKTPRVCKAKGGCASEGKKGGKDKVPMAKIAKALHDALTEFAPTLVEHAMAEGFAADTEAANAAEAILMETIMDLAGIEKALADAEEKLAALEKRAAEAEAKVAERDAEITKLKATDKATDEDILKGLPEPVRKRIEAAEKAAKDSAEAIEKMKAEAEERDAIAKAKDLGFGDGAKLGPILLRIAKGRSTAEDAKEIETLLKSASAVAKSGAIFKAAGSADGQNPDDPEAALNAKAAEIAKAKKVTPAAAYEEAVEQNPALYAAYIAKRRAANAAA